MLRYRLRTLLIVLAVLPPVIAASWWGWCRLRGELERDLGVYPVDDLLIPPTPVVPGETAD